jgi:protein DGCR14
MSLDTFQTRYTSEDNSSFTQILDEENMRRREKWGWAWEAQKKVEAQRDRMLKTREKLLIEPAASSSVGVRGRAVIEAPTAKGLITAKGEQERDETVKDETVEDATGKVDEVSEETEEKSCTALVLAGGDRDKSEQLVMNSVLVKKKDSRPAGVDGWSFKVSVFIKMKKQHLNDA